MKIQTKTLGEIEVNENEIITVVDGIFGFQEDTQYILLMKEDEAPFAWLQSIDEPNLAFVIIDPFLFKYNYRLKVSQEFLKKVDAQSIKDVLSYAIVVIPENNSNLMTANLQGPIIINPKNKKACQAISDVAEYNVKHSIIEELQLKKKKEVLNKKKEQD